MSGNEKVLVAVSGGPDSVCLVHLLNNIKDDLEIQLHIAHLDHGLRGEESEAEADYVSKLAEKLGIPATIGKRDVESGAGQIKYHWKRRRARSDTNFLMKLPGRWGQAGWL